MELKERLERLVFVDPEDEEIPYFWPALVISFQENDWILILNCF